MYDKTKLNVIGKTRSNPFTWRGQFTPEFIEYILNTHGNNINMVADPFSGSGTVLFEASKLHVDVMGCEVNPSAYAMSKFFEFERIPFGERWELCQEVNKDAPLSSRTASLPVYIKEESKYRHAYKNFIAFSQEVLSTCEDKQLIVFLLNILFKMEFMKKASLGEAWNKAFSELSSFLCSLPETSSLVEAHLCDARSIDQIARRKVDLFVTSPPYINVFNYHQNHRIVMEILDFSMLDVAKSEFGSNRKHRGNRFLTVIQYCLDMAAALLSMRTCITENGISIIVIGRESNVRKTAFRNGEILKDLAVATGTFSAVDESERHFRNKFGKTIYEDILTLSPDGTTASPDTAARCVVERHLQDALSQAPKESLFDLQNTIAGVSNVQPSPMFKY